MSLLLKNRILIFHTNFELLKISAKILHQVSKTIRGEMKYGPVFGTKRNITFWK